jgi:hypothetical protein
VLPTISQRTRLSPAHTHQGLLCFCCCCGREHGAVGTRSCQRFCPTLVENFLSALILAQEAAAGAFWEIICTLFRRSHCLGPKKTRQLIIRLLLLLRRTQLSCYSAVRYLLCIVVATKRGCDGELMRTEAGFWHNYQVERSRQLKLDCFAP